MSIPECRACPGSALVPQNSLLRALRGHGVCRSTDRLQALLAALVCESQPAAVCI